MRMFPSSSEDVFGPQTPSAGQTEISYKQTILDAQWSFMDLKIRIR